MPWTQQEKHDYAKRLRDCTPELSDAEAVRLVDDLASPSESDISTRSEQFGKVPVWIFDCQLSPHAISVFALLSARYADRTGIAFPGLRRIAADLHIGKQTAQRAIRELVLARALVVTKRPGMRQHLSNLYRLRFIAPDPSSEN